ncbi:MAG: hypothetical protein AAF244_01925, partial [Pseudomonadota bacterium]
PYNPHLDHPHILFETHWLMSHTLENPEGFSDYIHIDEVQRFLEKLENSPVQSTLRTVFAFLAPEDREEFFNSWACQSHLDKLLNKSVEDLSNYVKGLPVEVTLMYLNVERVQNAFLETAESNSWSAVNSISEIVNSMQPAEERHKAVKDCKGLNKEQRDAVEAFIESDFMANLLAKHKEHSSFKLGEHWAGPALIRLKIVPNNAPAPKAA